jgi:hypothetical protein
MSIMNSTEFPFEVLDSMVGSDGSNAAKRFTQHGEYW